MMPFWRVSRYLHDLTLTHSKVAFKSITEYEDLKTLVDSRYNPESLNYKNHSNNRALVLDLILEIKMVQLVCQSIKC